MQYCCLCLWIFICVFTAPAFCCCCFQFSSVQLLSRVWLFATPRIAARQASLSITNSQSSLKLTSIESLMPSSHLILGHPLFLLPSIPPSIRVFSSHLFAWGGQSTGVSALASLLLLKRHTEKSTNPKCSVQELFNPVSWTHPYRLHTGQETKWHQHPRPPLPARFLSAAFLSRD